MPRAKKCKFDSPFSFKRQSESRISNYCWKWCTFGRQTETLAVAKCLFFLSFFFFFFYKRTKLLCTACQRSQFQPPQSFIKQQIVYWVFFSRQLSFSVKSCIMENDPFSWLVMHSFKHSKMNLIKKLSDMPKMKKALFCLSRLGFQIRGGGGGGY